MSTIFSSPYITYHVKFSSGTKVVANNKQVNRGSCTGVSNGNECKVLTRFCLPTQNILILNKVYLLTSIIFVEIKR